MMLEATLFECRWRFMRFLYDVSFDWLLSLTINGKLKIYRLRVLNNKKVYRGYRKYATKLSTFHKSCYSNMLSLAYKKAFTIENSSII